MAILLLFCIPLVFAAYVSQLEDNRKHLFVFFYGVLIAILFLAAEIFLFSETDRIIDSLRHYLFHSFLIDTAIPVCIVTIIAACLSGFNFLPVPSALFGLFTVKIYYHIFLTSAHLRIEPILLSIIVYIGTLFIFDALLRFCNDIAFSHFVAYLLCFTVFIGCLLLGFLGLGFRFFGENKTVYSCIFAGIAVTGIISHFTAHRGKM